MSTEPPDRNTLNHDTRPHEAARDESSAELRDERPGEPVGAVLVALVREPRVRILRRWNWKSAVLSSGFRAVLFFFTNLAAGLDAATAAMLTELVFRGATAGFYGALTQAFRRAEPRWLATLTAMVLLPATTHSIEFVVHWLRGTERLAASLIVSCAFTALSTVFNLFAMRRGALIVGEGQSSLWTDLTRVPGLIVAFVVAIVRGVARGVRHLFGGPFKLSMAESSRSRTPAS